MTHFKLSKACGPEGASLGRSDYRGDPDYEYKFRLQRIYLDSGGYDSGGAYWGVSAPLYRAEGCVNGGDVVADAVEHFRADNRAAAKEFILVLYPKARFYR